MKKKKSNIKLNLLIIFLMVLALHFCYYTYNKNKAISLAEKYEQEDEYIKAHDVYKKILKYEKNNYTARYKVASFQYYDKQYEASYENFMLLLKKYKNQPLVYYFLANNLKQLQIKYEKEQLENGVLKQNLLKDEKYLNFYKDRKLYLSKFIDMTENNPDIEDLLKELQQINNALNEAYER